MTKRAPKEQVLRKWPKAYTWKWPDSSFYGVEIDHPPTTLGSGNSYRQAWSDAARRLKGKK